MDKYKINAAQKDLQEIIYDEILTLAREIRKGKKVAIVGVGEQGERLYSIIKDIVKIEYFLDEETYGQEKYLEIPVYKIEKVNELRIDVLFLASVLFRERDRKKIEQYNRNIKIIDIYEIFEKKGILLKRAFYQYERGCYENIIYQRKCYEKEIERTRRELSLQNVIYEYLYIKDFIYAFKYMDEYIQQNFINKEKYENLYRELVNLFQEVSESMEQRKEKDIFWFWNDQVEFCELKDMPYLSSIAEQSLFFEKAYTTAPAMRGIFSQVNRLDNFFDIFYEKTETNNSKLLQVLKKEGYDFCYCGDSSIRRTFADKYFIEGNAVAGWKSSNIRIWEGICQCLKSESPMLVLIHILAETHANYMSANLEQYCFLRPHDLDGNKIEDIRRQVKRSLKYIDEQQKFYCKLLGEKTSLIFMSDHGKMLTDVETCYENKMHHAILFVTGKKIHKSSCHKIFSFIDFYKLIEYIINPDEQTFDTLFSRKFAHVQDVDIYNKIYVERLINKGIEKNGWAFRATYGQHDKYICFRTGEEHYYRDGNEEDDLIQNEQYAVRIDELRKENGFFFIDIEKEEKFKYSRRLYE